MKLRHFLRDNLALVAAQIGVGCFLFVFLWWLGLGAALTLVMTVFCAANIVAFAYLYIKKSAYYNNLVKLYEGLDVKYLISEMTEEGGFSDSRIFSEILRGANKAMNDQVARFRGDMKAYREYIELWVHEIKTPIAGAYLAASNHDTPQMRSVEAELKRIETLVDTVLYYARSTAVEKDYVVKECRLEELINDALKKRARELIELRIRVKKGELDMIVYTDAKWLGFILDQILLNSIKYQATQILMEAQEGAQSVTLHVQDNGIGILPQDIGRVFEKGFTGENGRKFQKSTGMGLYLCKTLCDKLGLSIAVRSEEGTTVSITFPKSEMYFK